MKTIWLQKQERDPNTVLTISGGKTEERVALIGARRISSNRDKQAGEM